MVVFGGGERVLELMRSGIERLESFAGVPMMFYLNKLICIVHESLAHG